MPRLFPRRTVLLMVLALAAFGRFWWVTHTDRPATSTQVRLITLPALDAGVAP